VKAEPAPEAIKSSVATNGLVAVLFVPADAKGPLPAIIILGGSEGGMGAASARDGRVIAQHGYVTLQLAYFDAPGLPKGLGARGCQNVIRSPGDVGLYQVFSRVRRP
jgi:uncharacterized protein